MRYLLLLVLLSGCSAIQVTETPEGCTLSGALFEPRDTQAPVADFRFEYNGDSCTVIVGNG